MTSTLSVRTLGLQWVTIMFGIFLAGCASNETPSVDWNSRVGNYTYDQAKTELGAPSDSKNLPQGGTVVEWLTRRNAGNSGMTPFRAGGVDQPNGQALTSLPKSEYLVLTFDGGGKLTKWERVVR